MECSVTPRPGPRLARRSPLSDLTCSSLAKVWAGVRGLRGCMKQPLPSSAEPQAARAVGTSGTHSS